MFVHPWLDRRVARIPWADALDVQWVASRDNEIGDLPILPTRPGTELVESSLDADVVTCASCHVDGRDDGLSWPFADGPRQTPSLAGSASTGPWGWAGTVGSIEEQAQRTATLRMGGLGLGVVAQGQIAAYVGTVRAPDVPDRGSTDPLVLQGEALFASPAVGCAGCHAGPALTDGLVHTLRPGTPTNTPSLLGVAATAPYLHDGSRSTLRDVFTWSETGAMGDTSGLDGAELDALEAYLCAL